MKENWTKQMKQKLEGHKKTPPAGLWEAISSEMKLEPTPAYKPVAIRRWIWATAAVVLAMVGFFAFYQFDNHMSKLEASNERAIVSKTAEQKAEENTTESEDILNPEKYSTPVKLSTPLKAMIPAETKLLAQAPIINNAETETSEQAAEESIASTSDNHQTTATTEAHKLKQTYLPDVVEPTAVSSQSEHSDRWSIGLAGSNGLLLAANDYVNSMRSQLIYYDNSTENYYWSLIHNPSINPSNNNSYTQSSTITDIVSKHHIPLRFGLSLQYQLNHHLALVSGINYTYLKSEFSINNTYLNSESSIPLHNYISYDQKLSYIGIPLAISYRVWATDHLNIYLTGGTMLEKCVKVEVTDDDIDSHPWQWSVNASAGAEYNFTRLFGVYLEPSLGYYFDDGTSLQHYYKEHPLAPSIHFGLRLHLK